MKKGGSTAVVLGQISITEKVEELKKTICENDDLGECLGALLELFAHDDEEVFQLFLPHLVNSRQQLLQEILASDDYGSCFDGESKTVQDRAGAVFIAVGVTRWCEMLTEILRLEPNKRKKFLQNVITNFGLLEPSAQKEVLEKILVEPCAREFMALGSMVWMSIFSSLNKLRANGINLSRQTIESLNQLLANKGIDFIWDLIWSSVALHSVVLHDAAVYEILFDVIRVDILRDVLTERAAFMDKQYISVLVAVGADRLCGILATCKQTSLEGIRLVLECCIVWDIDSFDFKARQGLLHFIGVEALKTVILAVADKNDDLALITEFLKKILCFVICHFDSAAQRGLLDMILDVSDKLTGEVSEECAFNLLAQIVSPEAEDLRLIDAEALAAFKSKVHARLAMLDKQDSIGEMVEENQESLTEFLARLKNKIVPIEETIFANTAADVLGLSVSKIELLAILNESVRFDDQLQYEQRCGEDLQMLQQKVRDLIALLEDARMSDVIFTAALNYLQLCAQHGKVDCVYAFLSRWGNGFLADEERLLSFAKAFPYHVRYVLKDMKRICLLMASEDERKVDRFCEEFQKNGGSESTVRWIKSLARSCCSAKDSFSPSLSRSCRKRWQEAKQYKDGEMPPLAFSLTPIWSKRMFNAVRRGDWDMVLNLSLKYNVVELRDEEQRTVLWHACAGGQFKLAKSLMDQGAAIDVQDSRGVYAFDAMREYCAKHEDRRQEGFVLESEFAKTNGSMGASCGK